MKENDRSIIKNSDNIINYWWRNNIEENRKMVIWYCVKMKRKMKNKIMKMKINSNK